MLEVRMVVICGSGSGFKGVQGDFEGSDNLLFGSGYVHFVNMHWVYTLICVIVYMHAVAQSVYSKY